MQVDTGFVCETRKTGRFVSIGGHACGGFAAVQQHSAATLLRLCERSKQSKQSFIHATIVRTCPFNSRPSLEVNSVHSYLMALPGHPSRPLTATHANRMSE